MNYIVKLLIHSFVCMLIDSFIGNDDRNIQLICQFCFRKFLIDKAVSYSEPLNCQKRKRKLTYLTARFEFDIACVLII